MSINQTDVIDVISTAPDGKVVLTITDHHSWEETWHRQLLQDKINSYLKFIESGQILEEYPDASGRDISIQTVMKFYPTAEASSFLQKAKEIVIQSGIGFEWNVINFDEKGSV